MSFFVFALVYVVAMIAFFAVKLNHGKVVESSRPVESEIEAIDFYWRPG